MTSRRLSTALLGILALALLVRVGAIIATPDFTPLFDAKDFERHAASIAAGDGYPSSQLGVPGPTAFRPPLYPIALAVIDGVGFGITAERLLGALLGVATVLLIVLVAQRVWGRRVALIAGFIAALFPPLVVLNATLLSEVLFVPLVLAAVLAVLRYREVGAVRWAVVAGVLCGLATLTRTNGLLLVVAAAVGVWTVRPALSRAAVVAPLIVVLACAATLAPWVLRNALEFHRFVGVGTQSGYALAGTYNSESRSLGQHPGQPTAPNNLRIYRNVFASRRSMDEAQFIGRLNDRAVTYIRDHPAYVVETAAWNVPRVFDVERSDSFGRLFAAQMVQALGMQRLGHPAPYLASLYLVMLLALLGAVRQARGPPSRRAPRFVWLAPILLILPALVVYGLPRYRASADPFLVMLAAVAVPAAFERFHFRRAGGGLSDGRRT